MSLYLLRKWQEWHNQELTYHQDLKNEHSSHPQSQVLFGAIGVLAKSDVPVVSQPVVCVVLGMIQLVVLSPAFSVVMNQDLLKTGLHSVIS